MKTTIAGVRLLELVAHPDERGTFTELFCDHWETPIDPSQWSLVRSNAGVFRGLHVHTRHDEYFSVVSGHASVGLIDIRPDSPTYMQSDLIDMPANADLAVAFPEGLLHGWYFHEPTVHVQAVSEAYEFYSEDDNNGCCWNDPALPIEWPFDACLTTPKHDAFPPLADLLDRLGPQLRLGLTSANRA